MTSDAFINASRYVIALRGAVRQISSDQGSNFDGSQNEPEIILKEVDEESVAAFLVERQYDFCMNVLDVSHVGGVWERQIHTVMNVLQPVFARVLEIYILCHLHCLLSENSSICSL